MTDGLQQRLDDDRDIRVGIQGQLAGTAAALVSSQQDLADLTGVVASKASAADVTEALLTRATVSSLVQGLSTKQDRLDFASSVTVGALQTTTGGGPGTTWWVVVWTSPGPRPLTK